MSSAPPREGGRRHGPRVLADIAHALESAEGAEMRVRRALELLQQLVPYDRCALLHQPPEQAPELFGWPEPPPDEHAPLAARLTSFLRLLGEAEDERDDAPAPAPPSREARPHLAVPLVGFDQVVGVLFVERAGAEAYDEESLSLLTVAAAQLAAYLTSIRMAEEQARASRALGRAHDFQQLLVGIVSHDLRNPLGVILGSAALLLQRIRDERQIKTIERIIANSQRATRIINDLLDLTRARLGSGIPVTRSRVDLGKIVHELVEEIRVAHPSRSVELDCPPEVVGEWDADRMAQVLTNLLANALRYSPEDSPLRVAVRPAATDVVLEIHNRGPAIPPALLAHIFDPFERGELTRGAGAGLGLGLYIVQQIVAGHGGSAEARSSEEEGTTFTLILPRTPPAPR